MNLASSGAGNLLINGDFLPQLWTRLADEGGDTVPCSLTAQTFAADRWSIRYALPQGGTVRQARSSAVPPEAATACSLEIHGQEGLAGPIYLGQTIEADEARLYRRVLRLAVWCLAEHPSLEECPVRVVIGHAVVRDVFDATAETLNRSDVQTVPVNRWVRLDFAVDATAAREQGLRVELELPASFLGDFRARIRVTGAVLSPAQDPAAIPRSGAVETFLARRFFQRHSARSANAIGRALVCNLHELHFQFTFPEMRAFPSVTLPQDNADLTVFSPDGRPQDGFVYDVPYVARGSAMIRATKWHHGLADGFLAFRGLSRGHPFGRRMMTTPTTPTTITLRYRSTETGVERIAGCQSTFILPDPASSAWRDFLAWQAQGGALEPAAPRAFPRVAVAPKKLWIIGAGGFGREVFSMSASARGANAEWRVAGFLNDLPDALDAFPDLPPICAGTDYQPQEDDVFICAIGDAAGRTQICARLRARGGRFINLIQPHTLIAGSAQLGEGIIIEAFAGIGAQSRVGDFCSILGHVNIAHDVLLGVGVQISPFACLLGRVEVGDEVLIGSHAVILPGIKIGAGATVGAGAVVVKNVPAGETVFGVPAVRLK